MKVDTVKHKRLLLTLMAIFVCAITIGGFVVFNLDRGASYCYYKGTLTFATLESYYEFVDCDHNPRIDKFLSPHTEFGHPKALPVIVSYTIPESRCDTPISYPYSERTEKLEDNVQVAIVIWAGGFAVVLMTFAIIIPPKKEDRVNANKRS